jgi:2-dehydropantoate 2-reductase
MIAGALITLNGGQIDLVDANPVHVAKMKEDGAKFVGNRTDTIPVSAMLPDEMEGLYDLILLATKQTAHEKVFASLMPHLHEKSLVLTLQNGIPEDLVASYVGKERTAGGAVLYGGTWEAPGVVNFTSVPAIQEEFSFDIGEVDGQVTERIEKVRDFLSLCGGTYIHTDFMGIRWTKLLINSAISGMSAALGCTFGDVIDSPEATYCMAYIATETIAAAHAEGFRLVDMIGASFYDMEVPVGTDPKKQGEFVVNFWDPHRKMKASMLQDLEKGLPTEIDYINGHVCAKGRKHGIPTPFNDKVVELVKRAQSTKSLNPFSVIEEFGPLLAAAYDPK